MAAPASAADGMTVDQKMTLITRNLQEVMGGEVALGKLREIVSQRPLKVYWGTATTGAPHIAYFVPMSKIADFLRAGCEVTILFADLHAYLDNQKAPWELLKHRTEYYEAIIKRMLLALGVQIDKLKFTRGTEYQLSREYTLDMYKLTTITTVHDAIKAGAEVVKQAESPCLSGMLYPLLQALDEEYLHVDAQFGGVDQRKIFTLAADCLPRLGYSKRVHLMNPMVPGLTGDKMSSSEKSSKIDILDSADSIAKKIKNANCPEKIVDGNGVLAFVKMVLFSVDETGFTIKREEKFGGDTRFETFAQLEQAYKDGTVFPLDLKNSVTFALNALLAPIREAFQAPDLQALVANAYPEAAAAAAAASAASAAASSVVSSANTPIDVARLELRVGRVTKCENHPRAAAHFVAQVDLGEKDGRQVCTDLRGSGVSLDSMQGRLVVCLTNIKPQSVMGVKSFAVILAASAAAGTTEALSPPASAQVGERVTFAGYPTAASPMAPANDKTLKAVLAELRTGADGVAAYKGVAFDTTAGPVKAESAINAEIKWTAEIK